LVQEDEIKEGSSVTKWVNIEHDLTEIEINEIKFSQEGLSYQLKAEGDIILVCHLPSSLNLRESMPVVLPTFILMELQNQFGFTLRF